MGEVLEELDGLFYDLQCSGDGPVKVFLDALDNSESESSALDNEMIAVRRDLFSARLSARLPASVWMKKGYFLSFNQW